MLKIEIRKEHLEEIIKHCSEVYPEECCGLLVGKRCGEKIVVEDFKITANVFEGDRRFRYTIDPKEYLEVDRIASEKGLEIVGAFHSHTFYGVNPSLKDLELAIPTYVYLIISFLGIHVNFKAWMINEHSKSFSEVVIETV
ncbi:MAG: M67 family metallopeptidase [Nitrososphaerota archaeon]